MVRKPASLKLSQACEGFIRYESATGKSPNTLTDYRTSFQKLPLFFTADPPLTSLDRGQLVRFFVWLKEEYVSRPGGVAPRGTIRLFAISRLNIYVNLSALWQWAVDEGLVEQNLVRGICPGCVSTGTPALSEGRSRGAAQRVRL